MSNPFQARSFSLTPNPLDKQTLRPDDAAAMFSHRNFNQGSHENDPTDMFFRKAKREQSVRTSKLINGHDVFPMRRSASWTPDHTNGTPTTNHSLVTSSTFPALPLRSKSFFSRPTPSLSPSMFKRLPQEIFECILDQLRVLHADTLSPSCATCYMRDLVSLSLTTRAWEQGVRGRLYTRIHITGSDSPAQLKKYKARYGTRLRLLRRTLRERRMIASSVKELNVPDPNVPHYLPDGTSNSEFCQYRDLLASLVMVCPNLEKMTGFYCHYSHEFDRLTHALSTRRKLREHMWVIGANQAITERSLHQIPPGLMDQHQVYQFLHYHSSWTQLETLMMYSPGRAGVLEHGVFVSILRLLPSLKNLCVSSFDVDDFTDLTMLALPELTSLRLEECPGVTDHGLARWSSTLAARSLQMLSLIHQNLTTLLAISKVLTSLSNLHELTIVQHDIAPAVPNERMVLQPILASPSLRHLHWDITASTGPSSTQAARSKYRRSLTTPMTSSIDTPNAHLALSILHSGFPSLLTLRAPQDVSPPGALQTVCRPTRNGQILLPADRFSLASKSRAQNAAMPTSLPLGNALQAARIRAQSYIDSATKSKKEFMRVVVTDHSDYDSSSDGRDSTTSSSYSQSSTNPTEPDTLYPPEEDKLFGDSLASDLGPSLSKLVTEDLKVVLGAPMTASPVFAHSLNLHTTSSPPLKVSEFSLPPFVGRVATSASSPQPPRFHLLPDVPGYDAEGGIVGWVDLLRVKEKGQHGPNGPRSIKDGCTGKWNQGCSGGRHWWAHTERERRTGPAVDAMDLF